MRATSLFASLTALAFLACGGSAGEPAKPAPKTDEAKTAAAAPATPAEPQVDLGEAVPSAAWQAIGANVDARFAELETWASTNGVDAQRDADKIRAMKLAVAAKGGPPAWINKSSWHDKEADVLFGVGLAAGIRNMNLAFTVAENRSRAEIAKLLQTTVEQEKSASGTTTRSFTATTLSGTRIVDWYRSSDGTIYAVATLPAQKK